MKRVVVVWIVAGLVLSLGVACAPPDPEVIVETIEVEREVEVEVTVEVVREVPAEEPTPPPPPEGPTGSVRFLIAENFWADWTPYQTTAQSQRRVGFQIYDALMDPFTEDLDEFQPGLATEWEQIDELTWELKLREGVKFHDGQDFTAADVKASIELVSGATGEPTVFAGEWVPTSVEIVDDYTVRLITEEPFAPILVTLSRTPIISAEDLEVGGDRLSDWPNGTGPFRLTTNEPTRKVMEANLEYWGGAPQIQQLTWEFIQDSQTRLSALLAGQAHAIDRVPPEHLQIIAGSPDLDLFSVTGLEQVNLWAVPGRHEVWDNEDFRKAVMYGIDREALVRDLVQGNSAVATSFTPKETLFHIVPSPEYTFDPEKVQEHLEAAGLAGERVEFQIFVASGFLPRGVEVVEAVADSMRRAGLSPQVVTTDVSGLIDDAFSEDGTGMLYHLSWSNAGDPHGAFRVYGTNLPWYTDSTVDDFIQAGLEAVDLGEREAIYAELQQYMWDRMYNIPLYNSDFSIAYTANLEGLLVLPNFQTSFRDVRLVQD